MARDNADVTWTPCEDCTMARRRLRRNPIKTKGALLINGRRRKASKRKSARRKTARRTTRRTARRTRRNPARRTARRTVRRRNTSHRRRTTSARRNPRRRTRRKAKRVSYRRRNPRRRTPRRRTARRNPSAVTKWERQLAKIPVVGPLLGLAVPAGLGALSVWPTLGLAQVVARYFPQVPTAWLYPVSGILAGSAVKMVLGPKGLKVVSDQTATILATTFAAAGGGVAGYKWMTGQDAPAGEEMGALIVAGYGNPLAGAIMGDAGLGELLYQAPQYSGAYAGPHQGAYAGGVASVPVYGDYGPMSVQPLAGGMY